MKQQNFMFNSGQAMNAFANMSKMSKMKEDEYCKLDTLAMVKILNKLKEEIKRA